MILKFKGYLFANGDAISNPSTAVRLYVHEATRVYCDKLINFEDKKEFEILLQDALRKNIPVLLNIFLIPIILNI